MIRVAFTFFVFGLIYLLSPIVFVVHFLFQLTCTEDQRRKFIHVTSMAYGRLFFLMSGAKVHVSGLENLPKKKNICLVGNHQSNMDILLLLGFLPFVKGFIAKKSLGKEWILKTWMTSVGCFFLDRKDIKSGMQSIKFGANQLKSEHPMVIFPEGHRSKGGAMDVFNKGAMKMAVLTNSPIVPFSIEGTYLTLEKPLVSLGAQIYLKIHQPLDTASMDKESKKNLHESVHAIVKRGVEELRMNSPSVQ